MSVYLSVLRRSGHFWTAHTLLSALQGWFSPPPNFKAYSKADSPRDKFNPVESSNNMLSMLTECALGPQIWKAAHEWFAREREIDIPTPCDLASHPTQGSRGTNMPWPSPTQQLLRADGCGFHYIPMTTVYMDWLVWLTSLLKYEYSLELPRKWHCLYIQVPWSEEENVALFRFAVWFSPGSFHSLLPLSFWSGQLANASCICHAVGHSPTGQAGSTAQIDMGSPGSPNMGVVPTAWSDKLSTSSRPNN